MPSLRCWRLDGNYEINWQSKWCNLLFVFSFSSWWANKCTWGRRRRMFLHFLQNNWHYLNQCRTQRKFGKISWKRAHFEGKWCLGIQRFAKSMTEISKVLQAISVWHFQSSVPICCSFGWSGIFWFGLQSLKQLLGKLKRGANTG